MILEPNDLETARPGIVAARLSDPATPLEAVSAEAPKKGVQMITTHVEAADLMQIHALEADGCRLMDTLLNYSRRIDGLPQTDALMANVEIRLASSEDAPAVAEVAGAAFQENFNHYHADPRLDNAAADATNLEWAETNIVQNSQKRPTHIVTRRGRVAGFLTLRQNSSEEVEIKPNAMHAACQRAGIYSALVSGDVARGTGEGPRTDDDCKPDHQLRRSGGLVTKGFRV